MNTKCRGLHCGHARKKTLTTTTLTTKTLTTDYKINNTKGWLDTTASASISASQRSFLARNCKDISKNMTQK